MGINFRQTVILCDDDEDLLFLASAFLSKSQISVLKASTGYEAIEILKKKSEAINIIILDNTFKNSDLQGKDILPFLKEIKPNIPILISSGYPESYFKETYPSEIFKLIDGFIDKNYSSPNFVKTLESFFKVS